MNLYNAAKLRHALYWSKCPVNFDYRHIHLPADGARGKVGCMANVLPLVFHGAGAVDALGITELENAYLLGFAHPSVGQGKAYWEMTEAEATGRGGLAEARRRLKVVVTRHLEALHGKPKGIRSASNLTFAKATAWVKAAMQPGNVRVSCEPDLDHPGRWLVRAVPR